MTFEYPRGSGQVAEYDDAEAEQVRDLIRASETARMPRAEAVVACPHLIHEAKVYAGARLVPEFASS